MRVRSHLIILVLVAMLPVLVFVAVLVGLLAREQRGALELSLRGTTRALSAAVDERITVVITSMRLLAASEDFSEESLPDVHQRFTRAVASQRGWRSISLARADGEQLLSTQQPFGRPLPSLSDRDYLQRVVETGQPAVSGLLTSRSSGKLTVFVGVPVPRNGTVAYVLSCAMEISAFNELLQAQQLPTGWTAAILDQSGTILARSRAPEQFVGQPATPVLTAQSRERTEAVFEDVTQEGRPAYGAFLRSSLTGWTVVLGLPAHSVYAPVLRSLWTVIVGGMVLLALGCALAVIFGRRLTRPLLALSASAAALGRGQPAARISSALDEVNHVSSMLEAAAQERGRAEASLREANETFEALIQASPVAILVIEPGGTVRFWNPAAESILGWRRDEVLGRSLSSLGQESYAAFERLLLQGFEGAPLRATDWRQDNRRGEPVVLQVSTAVLWSAAGERRYVMAIIEDISERTRVLERLAEERQTVDTLHHIGSVLAGELDLQRLVQVLTDEATALVGAQFGAYFHIHTAHLEPSMRLYTLSGAPYEAFASFPAPRATAIFGPTFRGEGILRLEDVTQDPRYGQNAPYWGMPEGHLPVRSYLAVPVVSRTGEVLGALFFGHSQAGVFTARHEEMLAAVAAQAAVAIDNAHLYRQAQEAIRLRDDFLSVASHELKTPMTPLRLQLDLLLRKLNTNPQSLQPEQLAAAIERMLGQIRRLAHLVDELLDVSRIAAGRLELHSEELDVAALLREVAAHFEAELERVGSVLTIDAPSPVLGSWDRGRLEQVLTNLVSNAIKYGNGKPIELGARVEGGSAVVTVRDFGIGIAPEAQQRIFERFERAVSVRNYSGLGLGLWISQRILDRMGGSISLESSPGQGALFTVRLPIVAPPQG